MADNLGAEEFISESPTEYMTEPAQESQGLGGAGANTVAAFAAFNTEDPATTYRQVGEELNAGITHTQDLLNQQVVEEIRARDTTALASIISDPTISDEVKLQAAQNVRDQVEGFSIREETLAKSLAAPNGDESIEREAQRFSFSTALKEVDDYSDFKQKVLSSTAASMDFSGAKGIASIAASFLPYVREWASDDTAQRFAEEGYISPEDGANFFLFAGENNVAIKNALRKMTLDERRNVIEGMLSVMKDETGITFSDSNQAIMLDQARALLEEDFYDGDVDRFVDNAFGVLDILFLGMSSRVRQGIAGLVGFSKNTVKTGLSVKDLMAKSRRNSVTGSAQPASPGEAIRETNPEKTRDLHVAIVEDETGEVARATKGASRDDVIADDSLPDALDPNGVTRNFPSDVDAVQADIEHSMSLSGRTELSDVEKASARDTFLNKFTRPKFLHYRSAQSQVGHKADGGDFDMSIVFGETPDAGFETLDSAVKAATDQARRFGLGSDSIQIQARTNSGDYVNLDADMALEAAGGAGSDFLVKFDFQYNVSPLDVSRWEEAGVNQKLFGFINPDAWFPQAGGQLTRWMKDAQSIFDKRISGSGLAVEDRSSRLQKLLLADMASVEQKIKGLDLPEQEKLYQHVQFANREGVAFSNVKLKSDGFSDAAIESINSFRNFWDRDWRLNNQVKRNQLKSEGVVVLEDLNLGTKLYAKEDARFIRTLPKKNVKVYDLDTDDYKTITSSTALDEFFGEGRMTYRLEKPLNIDGTEVKWVIGNERSHVRPINNTDDIIPYREGYYKVGYTDSFFLERKVTDEWGEVTRSAVQSSDSVSDVIRAADKLNAENVEEGVEFVARGDVKDINDIRRMQDEAQSVSDGFRQYHRGERLGDASRPVADAEIENPIDAMKRSAGSVSRRMAYGNWIQTSKARFMSQYGDVIEKQGGKHIFPTHPRFIKSDNLKDKKSVNEARTTWEYINFMENVRMNYGAALWKYGLKSMEETFGESAVRGSLVGKVGEKVAKGAQALKPAEASKRVSFEAAVVFNPARQGFLGVFDVLTKGPIHGLNFLRGIKDAPAMIAANMARGSADPNMRKTWTKIATGMSGRTEKEIDNMLEAFHQSGLVAAIDKQALMSAGLHTEIERGATKNLGANRVLTAAENGYEKFRSIPYKGFEINEYMTQGIIWASRFNQIERAAKKAGRNKLNKTELEEITTHVRNLNYGQNRAGELAYNSSALGVLFQFIQIPHKAMMLISPQAIGGSKVLTAKQKAGLITTALALYGTPEDFFGVDIAGDVTANIEDEELRNTLRHGLAWNAFFNLFDASVSTRELSPFDAEAITDKFVSIFNGTPFADSPAAQFAWPRVTEAMRHSIAVWGVGYEDYDQVEKFGSVVDKWASISSGYSNYMKSAYAMKHGEFISSKGWLSDPSVTGSEAMLKFWGVRSLAEQDIFDTQQNLKKLKKVALDDVRKWYTDYKQSRLSLGDDNRQIEFINRAYAEFWRVYKDTPAAKFMHNELRRMVKMDGQQGETKFMRDMLRSADIQDPDDMKGSFNISGLDEEGIKAGHKFVDDLNDIKLYVGEGEE